MEGPKLRQLMGAADHVFEDIAEYLIDSRKKEGSSDDTEGADDHEIMQVCHDLGRLLLSLDSIFSDMMTKRNEVTDEIRMRLADNLDLLKKEWARIEGLSFTPKVHLLLDHAVSQLGWHADMGESAIERHHQIRSRIHSRIFRLRNKSLFSKTQAKIQNLAAMDSVQMIAARVKQETSRKRKNNNLVEDRKNSQKARRMEKRLGACKSLRSQDPNNIIQRPREALKEHLQE